MRGLLVISLLILSFSLHTNAQKQHRGHQEWRVAKAIAQELIQPHSEGKKEFKEENPRAVAIGLTVLLGPFGAHRIYLGTREAVPIFYTLTLGGGLGVLPVIDLIHLIFSKDLSRFVNNEKVIMW